MVLDSVHGYNCQDSFLNHKYTVGQQSVSKQWVGGDEGEGKRCRLTATIDRRGHNPNRWNNRVGDDEKLYSIK